MLRSIILTIFILLTFYANNFTAQNLKSVKSKISEKGITQSNFESYIFYLQNTQINFDEEIKFVNQKFKTNFQKNFAEVLIFKRQKKYGEAFQKLFSLISEKKKEFIFFNELVWLAKASDNLTKIKSSNYNSSDNFLINGLIKYYEGNYKNAIMDFTDYEKLNKPHFEINFFKSYGLRYLGDYQNALLELNKSEKIIDSTSKHFSQIQNAKGSLFYLSDNYEKAKRFFQNAKKHSKKFDNNIEYVKSLINLSILEDEKGNLDEARNLLNQANRIAKNINAFDLIGTINSELGVSYTFDNQLLKAEKHYQIAIEELNSIKQFERISLLHNNLGKIYLTMFNYNSALDQFELGLKFANENKRSKILNLLALGDVYSNLSNYSQALKYYEDANKLSKEIKEITLEFEIEMGLGILEFNLGNYKSSLKIFRNAKQLLNENDNPLFVANILHKIALNEFTNGDYTNAENSFFKSAELSQKLNDVHTELLVKIDLAKLYMESGKNEKAEKIITSMQPNIEKYDLEYLSAETKYIYAEIYLRKNNYGKAKILFNEVIELCKKLNEDNLQIEANFELGKFYLSQNESKYAEKYFLNSVNLIEEISNKLYNNQNLQISHFSKYDEIYNSLIEFYLEQKNYKAAFEILDNSRSRNTFQNLLFHKLESNIKNKELLNKYIELNWKINSIAENRNRDSLNTALDNIRLQFINTNSDLRNYLDRNKITFSEKQKSLKNDEVFISIFTNNNSTQFFIVSKNNIQFEKVNIGKNEIANLINEISPYYSDELTKSEIIFNQDIFAYNSQKSNIVYQKVFKKLLSKIISKKIIFSLPNEMINLPIETLVTEYQSENSSYDYEKVKFLIEKHEISYSPSLNIYSTLQKIGNKNLNSNLLIGDPIVNNNDFYVSFRSSIINEGSGLSRNIKLNPLKFSKEEINSISSILENSKKFISNQATENNFKKFAPSSNIIHISSHSFLINNQPFIVFSNDNSIDQDGFLERGEILNLNLQSELVVLSSCKSGLGEIDKREGVLGMQKSFFDAGAKSVIVSLWDVNDKFTYLFMELFYNNLKNGLSKSESLKKAKIEFIKQYSANPYYWAAFVLSGNNSSMFEDEKESNYYFIPITIFVFIIIYFCYVYFTKNRKHSTFL